MSDVIWVRMTISISGGRADGREWPPVGTSIDLPPAEAIPLIRAGNAVQVDAPPEPPKPLPPPASMTPAPRSEPAVTARGPEPLTPEPDPLADPEPPSLADLVTPKPADPKQAWTEYAQAHGESYDDANMQTKAELMQKYGGRL